MLKYQSFQLNQSFEVEGRSSAAEEALNGGGANSILKDPGLQSTTLLKGHRKNTV
jgi:hypothetical protein